MEKLVSFLKNGITLLVLVACIEGVTPGNVQGAILCLESDGETVRTRRREVACTNRGGTRLALSTLTGQTGPQGETGPSALLCWANIQSDGTLNSYGGSGTTGVVVVRDSAGAYSATCTGTYTGLTGSADISTFTTPGVSTFTSAATSVTVNETTIDLNVFTRNSSGTLSDQDVKVLAVGETS